MKRSILFTTSLATAIGLFALGANAESQQQSQVQSQQPALAQQHLTISEIANLLEGQGYTVREIELERNHYEVKMTDAKGMRIKAYLNPITGDVLPYKGSDDDHHRGGHDKHRYGDDD